MKRLLLVILVLGLEVGCAESPVTDIGNPSANVPAPAAAGTSVPAFGQLVGAYAPPSASMASPSPTGGTNSPDTTSLAVSCQSDSTKPHSITLGTNPTDLVLINFFSYGAETDQIHSVYNTGTGVIAFQVSGSHVTMDCTGKATQSFGTINVDLTCQQTRPQAGACIISYSKKSS